MKMEEREAARVEGAWRSLSLDGRLMDTGNNILSVTGGCRGRGDGLSIGERKLMKGRGSFRRCCVGEGDEEMNLIGA